MSKIKRFFIKLILFIIFQTIVVLNADTIKEVFKQQIKNTTGDLFIFKEELPKEENIVQPQIYTTSSTTVPEEFEVNVPIFGKITGKVK